MITKTTITNEISALTEKIERMKEFASDERRNKQYRRSCLERIPVYSAKIDELKNQLEGF